MPNKNYTKGRAFEHTIRKEWEKMGCYVMRSAGSKGVFDLAAIRPATGQVILIQCKVVQKLSAADKLLRDFKDNPPFKASKVTQLMCVKCGKGYYTAWA